MNHVFWGEQRAGTTNILVRTNFFSFALSSVLRTHRTTLASQIEKYRSAPEEMFLRNDGEEAK